MESQWLIIGISGATCSGKTTLAREFIELLPNTKSISQDDYFWPKDSNKHILIPELNHFNWEILTSLDMEKMYSDIVNIVGNKTINFNATQLIEDLNSGNNFQNGNKKDIFKNEIHLIQNKLTKSNINILLIEGFSIFNYEPIDKICHFKFFLTLNREICYERRRNRVYDPPDVPGYFEKCVWPEYIRQLTEVQEKSKNVIFFNEVITNKCACILKYLIYFFQNFVQ